MATTSPRLSLYMPADDGSEPINVATDLNDNLEKIDASIGFVPATEASPPVSPYNGMGRYNTDTGRASYWRAGTSSWVQLLTSGVEFANNIIINTANRLGIGTTTPGAILDAIVTSITSVPLLRFRQTSEGFPRFQIDSDGIRLGSGTVASDVRIYRPTSNQLAIQGSVSMNSGLSVTGTLAADSLNISGNISLDGVVDTDLQVTGTVTVDTELAGGGIGVTHYRRRTSDLARASVTTPAVDSVFDYDTVANGVYLVEMFIFYAGLNTADFKCSWNVPVGSGGPRWCLGMPSANSDASNTSIVTTTTGFTSEFSYGTQTTTAFAGAREVLTIATGASAGVIQFKWSQATSSGTGSILRAGSTMRVTRIA